MFPYYGFLINRCYGLPIFVMGEAKQFYPEEWAEIESLRKYKLAAMYILVFLLLC